MADVVGIGKNVFGEAAVPRVAGVLLFLTQCLRAAQTVLAIATGGIEPGDADSVAFLHVPHARADGDDVAHALMTRDKRWRRLDRPVAVCGVEVGVANARRGDLDEDLSRADFRCRHFFDRQRLAEFTDNGCFHCLCGLGRDRARHTVNVALFI